MALKTIQIADKPTLDGARGTASSNGAKLDEITNFLESGGGIKQPGLWAWGGKGRFG